MNWKSYAAVSGATVLAGWFASAPPSNAPAGVQAPSTPRATRSSAAEPDIEEQAMRLQARVRLEREYSEPSRNPFRFAPRQAPLAGPDLGGEPREFAPPPPPVEADITPRAPVVALSGIAEDQIDGRLQRTAVLSSPQGVLLVREGDEILGMYRVARIENEAVELVSLETGEVRRLALGR